MWHHVSSVASCKQLLCTCILGALTALPCPGRLGNKTATEKCPSYLDVWTFLSCRCHVLSSPQLNKNKQHSTLLPSEARGGMGCTRNSWWEPQAPWAWGPQGTHLLCLVNNPPLSVRFEFLFLPFGNTMSYPVAENLIPQNFSFLKK